MENKKSNGLIALCILSWISIAYQAFTVSITLTSGPPTEEQINEAKVTALEELTPETAEAMRWVIEDTEKISRIQRDNFGLLTVIDVIGILLGLMAVLLMFRLRKIGFHLYIVYTLLSITYWSYFYAGLASSATLIGFTAGIGVLFVILYGVQSKKMV